MSHAPHAPAIHHAAGLRRLAQIAGDLGMEPVARFANQLADDLAHGAATVLVCGEFKRGKSSLVNALIGQDLLPVDVVPTTAAIHVLRHAPEPVQIIHWHDGQREERPLAARGLIAFASDESGGTVDPEQVDYIEIGLPSPLLASGLVLVDTPGTNDLSRTRSEIVYRMIPRADAVLFVLNAETQLVRSEVSFLTDRLVRTLAPPLCFVLNKTDTIEPDERENIGAEVQSQLAEHLPGLTPHLVLTSTREAAIGVQPVAQFLANFVAGGERHAAAAHKRARLVAVMGQTVQAAIDERLALLDRTAEDLAEARRGAETAHGELGQRLQRFVAYLDDQGPRTLAPLVERSLRHHLEELTRRLVAEARTVGTPAWADNVLPLAIESGLKNWLERKTPEISIFLDRWQQAMSAEFARHFAPTVAVRSGVAVAFAAGHELHVEASGLGAGLRESEQRANLMRLGLPAAGAAIAAVVATGGMALMLGAALGGMGGFFGAQRRLEQARELLASQLGERIRAHGETFLAAVLAELDHHAAACAGCIRNAATALAKQQVADLDRAHQAVTGHDGDRQRQRAQLTALRTEVEALAVLDA